MPAALAIAFLLLMVLPGTASAAPPASLALTSYSEVYPENTRSAAWTSATGSISGGAEERYRDGQVWRTFTATGRDGKTAQVSLSAPEGRQLRPGFYPEAGSVDARGPEQPGLMTRWDDRVCVSAGGSFDLRELRLGPDGVIEALWVVFEEHCGDISDVTYGELRIGMPPAAGGAVVAPAAVSWREEVPGPPHAVRSVTLVNPGLTPLAISSSRVVGPQAAEFPVVDDGCTGTTVAPGTSCAVRVGFRPTRPGPRYARLEISDAAGTRHASVLEGAGASGRTRVVLHFEDDDPIGRGADVVVTPRTGYLRASGHHGGFGLRAVAAGGEWRATFQAPTGDVLVPGEHRGATAWGDEFHSGLNVSGPDGSCDRDSGDFTVHTVEAGRRGMERFAADFTARCPSQPPLRGTVEYRAPAGDQTAPGPVTGLSARREAGRTRVTWTDPADDDRRATIVRYLPGARPPAGPLDGWPASVVRAGEASIPTTRDLAVAVSAVDWAGNVSPAVTAVVPAGATPPPDGDAARVASVGGSAVHDDATGRITLRGDRQRLYVDVERDGADVESLAFGAPAGALLKPGLYERTLVNTNFDPDRPMMDVACEDAYGAFDIKEIAADAGGRIERLWLTYRASCWLGRDSVTGEVRIGMNPPAGSRRVVPAVSGWPETAPGGVSPVRPVMFANTGDAPVEMAAVRRSGLAAADWVVRADRCTGRILRPDERCEVRLRFRPQRAGPRFARLDFVERGGGMTSAALEGRGAPGETRVQVQLDPGYPGVHARNGDHRPGNANILLTGRATRAYLDVVPTIADDAFSLVFAPPAGSTFARRTYYGATNDSWVTSAPELAYSDVGPCEVQNGRFTINSIGYGTEGEIRSLSADILQRCGPGTTGPALRAAVRWRAPAGDARAPAPVTGLRAWRQDGLTRLAWTNPADEDWAAAVVRRLPGTAAPARSELSGIPVTAARVASTSLRLPPGAQAFAVYAIDRSGNVSRAATVVAP